MCEHANKTKRWDEMMKSNKAKAMRQFTQWEMTTQQENRYGKYTTLY